MRRTFLAVVAALSMALTGVAMAADQDFTLVNTTGFEIDQLFVSPHSSNNWGSDVLGRDVLPAGNQTDITFPPNTRPCAWDLKVVYSDGGSASWANINLCSISKVTLFYNRQTDTTRAVTE